MRNTILYLGGAILLSLAAIGAVIAIPLVPNILAMQWGCSF